MFERGVLVFTAIVWLPYGLYCFLQPGALAEMAGVTATSPTGSTELRAMYGGVQMAIGLMALAALRRPELARGVFVAIAFLTAGLFTTRLVGAALDGGWSAYTGGGLFFEALSWSLAAAALRRSADAPASEA